MNTNILNTDITQNQKKISQLFRILGQPSHVEILLAIGKSEACVCHLEAITGWRQAYISQNLMALRNDGLVTSHRDGRNIYYRLKNKTILDLVDMAAIILGITGVETAGGQMDKPVPNCPCPHCNNQQTNPAFREIPNFAVRSSN